MKCLVLAAGYATRLYPLTQNFPKPLLKVKDKTILDWLLDDIDTLSLINEYVIVSNHRYYEHFVNWAENKKLSAKITVLDDGSTENDNRLGAVADIDFAIKKLGIKDDLMVIAGDNVLDFSLCRLIEFFKEKNKTSVMRYFEARVEKLQKSGVAKVDDNDKIISMAEKPEKPESNWCIPPFYIYEKGDIEMIAKGIEDGCKTDAPGSFIAYLCEKRDVYALEMPGKRYDIGDNKSYEEVQNTYQGIIK